jgi:hypothetical protein
MITGSTVHVAHLCLVCMARYIVHNYLTLCQAKVNEFQISETKCESLCDESIIEIKKREKTLIDEITKHSKKLHNEIELERKTDEFFLRVQSCVCCA